MRNLCSIKNVAILFLPALIAFSSCKKQEEKQKTGNVEELKGLLEAEAPVIQTFSLDAGQANSITGDKGTEIYIPKNAFADKDGNPVSGSVVISLQEIYSPGDMILTDKMTTSDGKLLVSGGELYFNARQNGEDLQIATQKEVNFRIPQQSTDPQMQFFAGNSSDGNFNWVLNPNIDLSACADSGQASYCFGLDTMINWINCDYFYSYPGTLTDVDIQVPAGYDDNNTLVYVYVPSINSITTVYNYSNQLFSLSGGYKLPVGLNVIFIAIHDAGNGSYTLAYSNTTITLNHLEVLNFQNMTLSQIVQVIQSL